MKKRWYVVTPCKRYRIRTPGAGDDLGPVRRLDRNPRILLKFKRETGVNNAKELRQ